MKNNPSRRLTTPIGFIYFPALTEPLPMNPFTNKPEEHFSATLLLESGTDLTSLKKAVYDTATEMWPEGVEDSRHDSETKGKVFSVKDALKKGILHNPLLTKNLSQKGFPEDSVYIRVKTKQQPVIVDSQRESIDPSTVQAGNKVCMSVSIFPFDKYGGAKGITIWLNGIQRVSKGKPPQFNPAADFEIIPTETIEAEEAA